MTDLCICGVDPGVQGGVAFLRGPSIQAFDIPTVDGEINVDELVRIVRSAKPDIAVIERASSRPGQGVASTFRYGVAYGVLRAVVAFSEIPSHLVAPTKWKKYFALDSDKEKSRALALRLWPGAGLFNRKKDHGRAEAALIGRFGAETLWRRG